MTEIADKGTSIRSRRTAYSRPARPARVGLAVVGGFVALMALWGAAAPLSGAAVASGVLQVEGRRQSVQHPYGGVVRNLNVTEGQQVRKGDVLIELDDTEPRARVDVLAVERLGVVARLARLEAEQDQRPEIVFPPELEAGAETATATARIAGGERALFDTRRRQLETSKQVLGQRIAQQEQGVAASSAELASLTRQAELLEDEAQGARTLLKDGFTPRTRVLQLERDVSAIRAQIAVKQAEMRSGTEAIGEAKLEIARLERTRMSEIADETQKQAARLAELNPQIAAARDVLARTRITAPADGEVVSLAVFTEGGVIQQGARLMDVVPDASPLFVDARLKLADISQIRPGHAADIRLVATPRNRRPHLDGTVSTVSADRLSDQRTGESYYAIQVAIDADDAAASDIRLQAGMPVEVVLPTQSRTLFDYLTSPLVDEVTGAFREP